VTIGAHTSKGEDGEDEARNDRKLLAVEAAAGTRMEERRGRKRRSMSRSGSGRLGRMQGRQWIGVLAVEKVGNSIIRRHASRVASECTAEVWSRACPGKAKAIATPALLNI
jgi:hypothetical protein